MSSPTPVAAIDALLVEKRKAREELEADIRALERTRDLLAGAFALGDPVVAAYEHLKAASLIIPPNAVLSPGAWHAAALKVFDDGEVHTTSEVHDAAKAAVGQDVNYSAVASWLNRMAERGTLLKDDRGKFRRPPQPNESSGEVEGAA